MGHVLRHGSPLHDEIEEQFEECRGQRRQRNTFVATLLKEGAGGAEIQENEKSCDSSRAGNYGIEPGLYDDDDKNTFNIYM